MRRMNCLPIAIFFVLLLSQHPAVATTPPEPQPEPDGAMVLTVPEVQLPEEGRFALAVGQSRDTFNVELSRLTELFRQAGSQPEALDAQRRITALKQGWEIELMEIQLRFAREAGRVEQVAELESVIVQARAAVAAAPADAGR